MKKTIEQKYLKGGKSIKGNWFNSNQKIQLTPANIRAIKQSPKGQLPSFMSVGGKGVGASLLRTKSGAEVQAGIGKLHVDAGFDTKARYAGAGLSIGKRRFNAQIQSIKGRK